MQLMNQQLYSLAEHLSTLFTVRVIKSVFTVSSFVLTVSLFAQGFSLARIRLRAALSLASYRGLLSLLSIFTTIPVPEVFPDG